MIQKNDRYGMHAHVITVDGKKVSFAELVVAILSDPRRATGVKGSTKYAKREREAKISLRRYFAVHHGNTDTDANSVVPILNTTYRCNEEDFPKRKGEQHNGLMGHYHIVASCICWELGQSLSEDFHVLVTLVLQQSTYLGYRMSS